MFKNYLLIGWRNLLRQKTPSFINIFGLSCTIGCCLVAYLFIDSYLFKDRFHEHRNEIYLLTHSVKQENEVQRYGTTATPISDRLRDEIASIQQVVRLQYEGGLIKYRNEAFSEGLQLVDPALLEVFTFPLKYGSPEALRDPQQVVIVPRLAEKLFGKENPVGEEIDVQVNGKDRTFIVGGVLEEIPSSSSLHLTMLVHYDNLSFFRDLLAEDWSFASATFVQIDRNEDMPAVLAGLERMVARQNEAQPDEPYLEMQLEPLTTLARHARAMRDSPASGIGGLPPVILLATISLFMLFLSVFNYINIATLTATQRIKEIGIRKTIGSRRRQLIAQFLSENLLVCFLALVLGAVLASLFFLPWFNQIAGGNLKLDLLRAPHLWVFFGLLLLLVSIASGAYPAFYISSFKPTVIFKGAAKLGSKSRFTSVLLTFQFVLAVITIVGGLVFVQTNRVNEQRDWGYDRNAKIIVNVPSDQVYQALRDQLSLQPDVVALAGSVQAIGRGWQQAQVQLAQDHYTVDVIDGAANYPQLMDLRLAQGRFFDPVLSSDTVSAIMVNQTLMREVGLSFPTDQPLVLDSIEYHIVGVVEDFHYRDFSMRINPLVLRATPERSFQYLTVSVAPGTEGRLAGVVKALYQEQATDVPYEGFRQSTVFDHYFSDMNGVRNVLLFTATLATILSAMGLFGLVSLSVSARIKDFGIRKVLGANVRQLSEPIYRRFTWLLAIGAGVGGTVAYFLISLLLDSVYQYHIGIGVGPIALAVILLTAVAGLTISSQILKVMRSNPVDTLRTE